jgi:hypothetical protein
VLGASGGRAAKAAAAPAVPATAAAAPAIPAAAPAATPAVPAAAAPAAAIPAAPLPASTAAAPAAAVPAAAPAPAATTLLLARCRPGGCHKDVLAKVLGAVQLAGRLQSCRLRKTHKRKALRVQTGRQAGSPGVYEQQLAGRASGL